MKLRKSWLFIIMLVLLVGLFAINLLLGSVSIPFWEIVRILAGQEASREAWQNIVLQFRLPRAITATLAGAALAISGLQMQTLFRNPLAGPFVLGISSGASLGVALLMLGAGFIGIGFLPDGLEDHQLSTALAASLGAIGVLLLILLIAGKMVDNVTLLIVGLMLGYFTSALVSILMYFSGAEDIRAYLIWTFGSFARVTNEQLWILGGFTLAGLLISSFMIKWLNALLLGPTYAKSLGIPMQQARTWLIISTGILAGTITAFCGPIAFIGIAIPHLARAVFDTSNHRILVPSVMIIGSIVALLCDVIARLPGQEETLPINAVTSLIGAPVVLWVIIRMKNLKSSFGG